MWTGDWWLPHGGCILTQTYIGITPSKRKRFKGNYSHYSSLAADHVPRQFWKYKELIFWNALPCLSQASCPGGRLWVLHSQLANLAPCPITCCFLSESLQSVTAWGQVKPGLSSCARLWFTLCGVHVNPVIHASPNNRKETFGTQRNGICLSWRERKNNPIILVLFVNLRNITHSTCQKETSEVVFPHFFWVLDACGPIAAQKVWLK